MTNANAQLQSISAKVMLKGLAYNTAQLNRLVRRAQKSFSKLQQPGNNKATAENLTLASATFKGLNRQHLAVSRTYRAYHLLRMMQKGYHYHEIEEKARHNPLAVILDYGPQLRARDFQAVCDWLGNDTVREEWLARCAARAEKTAPAREEAKSRSAQHASALKAAAEQSVGMGKEERRRFVAEVAAGFAA